MTPEELDRLLAGEKPIAPSPGFAQSVMRAVQNESRVPPPIPFPWSRALVGIVATVLALAGFIWSAASADAMPIQRRDIEWLYTFAEVAGSPAVIWTLAGVLITVAALALSLQLASRREVLR